MLTEDQKAAIEAELTDTPELEVKDEAAWQATKEECKGDWVNESIVTYAERWGRLMQIGMANGHSIADIADEMSHKADFDLMSGATHQQAARWLVLNWRHGAEFLHWFNRHYIEDEAEADAATAAGKMLNIVLMPV